MFKKLGKKIDALIDDVKSSKDQAKDELKPRLEELKRNKKSIEKEFKVFIGKHKGTLDEIEKKPAKSRQSDKRSF